MIISARLPKSNRLFGNLSWKSHFGQHLLMLITGILHHRGRMSAQQAAGAIVGVSRHRAAVGRFLTGHASQLSWVGDQCCRNLLNAHCGRGIYAFLIDTTNVGHQGQKTENTFSTGNRRRRPVKGRRYNKYRHARRSCHAFVWGLLVTPDGRRIPSFRSYYTRDYCQQRRQPHRTQADLAAELIKQLLVPQGAEVFVIGDTAFESKQLRTACAARGFYWIVPANPERVLSGPKPRPKLWSRTESFRHRPLAPVRLSLDHGPWATMRRIKRGSINTRTFYVHEERLTVHSLGKVRVVFSTKQRPLFGKPLSRDETKVLLTNAEHRPVDEILQLFLIRWQIELFFKELKSSLGMHQYRFRDFQRVEAWMQAYRITFLYLEWIRVEGLRNSLTAPERQWWSCQRSHGLSLAVCQRLEEAQLRTMSRQLQTEHGLRTLRKLLRNALAKEYRHAA